MKGINLILFTVLCGAVAVAQPSNPPSTTFRSNGTFGNANGTTPDGLTQFMLTVTRGTGNNSPQPGTFVNYFVSSQNADSNGFTTIEGFGTVPNTALQGDSTAHLVLNFDSSQVTGFTVIQCVIVFSPTFSNTCENVAGGPVQAEWQRRNTFSQHLVSNNQQSFPATTTKEQINSDVSDATTSGVFAGLSFNGGGGFLGVARDTLIIKQLNH